VPTLLNKNGFKFFFYANEHEPKDLKIALEIIKENQSNFTRIWDEWFN
jgi:hypothetical protein